MFWWTILLWVGIGACVVAFLISPPMGLVVVPLGLLFGLALLFLTVWFTVKSVIGLLNLLGGRAP